MKKKENNNGSRLKIIPLGERVGEAFKDGLRLKK